MIVSAEGGRQTEDGTALINACRGARPRQVPQQPQGRRAADPALLGLPLPMLLAHY